MGDPALTVQPDEVLHFWFEEAGPKRWFARDAAFDALIGERFGAAHEAAKSGALDGWAETAEGSLALLILLDQFSRNLHRGQPEAFAADPKAREVARAAIARGFDQAVPTERRSFFYLPFEHSEDLEDQRLAVQLFGTLGDANLLDWAERHRRVIERFGRFPHRNAVLGRDSTAEELAFLEQPDSRF